MATFFEWLKRTLGQFQSPESHARHSGKETFPRVYDSQLEDRRVLNAGAVVTAIDLVSLHFDAGQAANDGIADTFELTRLDSNSTNQIAVSINDHRVWQGNAAQLEAIRFDGSSDADQFYIDPTIQVPAGIFIDGIGIATREPTQGVLDVIVFAEASGTHFDEITYQTTDQLTQVRFALAVVQVQNVESIRDLNSASIRSIVVETSGGTYSLQDSAESFLSSANQSVRWTSEQGQIDFSAPSTRFAIDFRDATAGLHSLSISTTDLSGVKQFEVFGKETDSVQLSGDLLTGQKMSIQAGAIRVDGTISTVSEGEVKLDAGSGVLTIQGQILSRGDDLHQGGNVVLTGDRVLLQERTRVDVSGGRGGGQIRVGGGYQGQDSGVRNSRFTFVSANTTLNADARNSGNGGTIIVWSDDTSIIDGSGNLFARGGYHSGNGGFIETSGKRYLRIDGAANTFAYQGQVGTWLIDPNDIEIVTAAGAAANTTYITTATIASGLTTGNVSIITNTASPANGDIRIVAALTLSPTVSRTLTLNATRDIVFQSGLTGNANLQVNLTAGRNVDSTAVSIGQLGSLTIDAAGNISVGAINLSGGTLTATVDSDNSDVNATFQSTGALSASSISITGSATVNDDLTFGSTVTTTTGAIQFSAMDDLSFQGDITAATNVTFSGVAGPLSLGTNVDVTATNGPLDFSTITSGIVLAGSNSSTNILRANGATGSLTLGSVTATNTTVGLTLSSTTNISVASINIKDGTLTSTIDSDNNNGNATFQSTGALSAGAISIIGSAIVNDDLTFGSTVATTTGAIQFSALDDLSFQGDITAATNITFTNVAGPLSLDSDVDVTATNGPLDFSTITSGVVLAGSNSSTNILRANGATGSLTLGSVTATNTTVGLTLSSSTNISVASISIQSGTLTSTIDSDDNNVNATFQSTGALSAGAISIAGSTTVNDDLTFVSTVTSTTGSIQFSALDDLSFQGDVTAATSITFTNVAGPLSLGDNVDITSNSGLLDFTTITSGVLLNGVDGTTNIITANSTTGSIKLAAVSSTNTSVSLTINSATDLDANDVNIQSGDLVATYSGQNVAGANVATFQKVTARSMTVSGNSRADDQTVLSDTLTIGTGGVTINQFSDLRINASVTSDAGVTTTGIAGSTTRLTADVTSKGGNIAMTGGTLLIDGAAARTISSGGGGVAAGGAIVLGDIDGENGAASLTVDSRGTATAGSVTIGNVTDDTSGLNRLNIQTSAPTASGQVTLSSTRLVGKALNTAATLVVSSGGNAIRANGIIDLSSNNTIDGGSIDFGSSEITPTTASSTLTLKTSNTNSSGGNGGDIKFGGVSNNGANYFDSVQIDTSAANNGSTAGDLDFNGAASPRIAVDGTTGTGISLIGTIVKAFSGVLSFLTNPTGASTSSSSINVSQADFQSTAGLAFDTSGGGASTNAGNVVLGDIGVLMANRPSSLSVDTRGSAVSGDLVLDDGAGASTEVHVNGDLSLANTKIKLTDNALLRTYGTGNMALGDVSTSTAVARNLTLNSEANIAVSAINLTGGTMLASIDSDNNNVNATFQSTGALSAGAISIAGSTTVNDDLTFGSTVATTTGAIQFSALDDLSFQGDITAATNITFTNVAGPLSLDSDVDVTATNGPLDFSTITSGVVLAGSNSSTNILRANGATGSLTLGSVTATNTTVGLTLSSSTNISVASISIQSGTLTSTIDSDDNNVNATFQSTGALSAGAISIAGSTTVNDDLTFVSTVTSTTGSIQFSALDDLSFQGDVTAATSITFTNVAGPLSLGDNVDITSNSGLLDFTTITSGVLLNGVDGTTNIITANSTTGSIKLAAVSSTNTSVSLTINSATDLDANDVNIQSGDLVATYSGQNVAGANVATFQKVTARSMTVSGNSRADDQTVLSDTLTIGTGGVTINQFSDLRINASVTSDAGVTTTGIAGSTTRLTADVTSKGGNIAMTGGTLLIDGAAARTISSGGGGVAAGGAIVLGDIDGENGAASLTVDSRGTATAGSVTIGNVTDDTSGLNRLNIQTSAPTASGQVTLSSTRLVGKALNTAATLVVSSGGNAIRANGIIDLSSNNTIDGGSIDFGSSEITPTTASSTLTLKTSNTNSSGGNGGDIKFGGVSNNGANYFDSVQIDTSAANNGSTAGDLDFNGAASPRIAVDGTTGTGISLIGTIVKAFSGVLSFLTNPTGASTSSSSINVSQADFQSTAGLAFDTSGGGASTNAGNVVLGDIGVLVANRPSSLSVDTRGSAVSGDLVLDDGAGASTEVHVNGDLSLANTKIKLTDNALLRTYGTGNMALGDVSTSTAVARNLILNSEANIAVSAINLTGGTLTANIDSDNNNAGATFQSTGVLTVGTVTISGSTTINDQVTIGSILNTTTGAIQFSQIGSLVLNGDVTAQTSVAFNSIANELILGSNVDVTANNGPIDFSVIASGIRLTGSNGSTNVLTANGASGNLSLGSVVVNNPSVSLTLRSAANTTVGSVTLQSGVFDASIDSDNNNFGSTFVSTGALSAGAITVSGSTTVNDDVTFGSTVTTTIGAIQVIRFDDLRINGDWTSAGGITTTGISVSKTHLAANITTNGGSISMLDGTLLVNGTTVRQVKSGGAIANAINGGTISLGIIDGEVSTAELELDSRGATTSGGVTLGDVTAASGNTGINRLQITTTGPAPGQVSLSNIRLIAKNGTSASLTVSSSGRAILADGTIDLSSSVNGQAGGNVDFGTSIVAPKSGNSTLTINTSNTNTTTGPDGSNGGDVLIGGIGVNSVGATYFNSVTLDLSAADILDAAGILRFGSVANPTIQVDGVTGTGIRILGQVDNAAGGTTNFSTNPAGAIQNSSSIDVSRANFIGSGGLVFDTSGGNRATNSGSVSIGDIGITVRPVSLVVDTRGTVTSGHLLLDDGVAGSPTEIRVDGTIDFSSVLVDLLDDVSLGSFVDGSSLLLGTTNAVGGARGLQLSSNSGMSVASINLSGGAFQANVDANNNEIGATFRSTGTIAAGSFALNGSATNDDTAIIETSLTTTGTINVSNLDQLRIQGTITAGTSFAATNIVGAVDFSGNSGITATGLIDLQNSVNTVRLSGIAGNTTLIDARGNASVVSVAAVTAINPGTFLNIRSDYSADLRNVDMQTGTLEVQIGRSTTLTDSKAQLREVIAGRLVVAGTSTVNDSVVLDGLLDIGTGGVRIENLAKLDVNFNVQSDGEMVATNISNRIRIAESVSVQSDLGMDMQTNVGQIQLVGINGLANLFQANGDTSSLKLATVQALQNVALLITSANNIQITSIDAVGSNITIDVDSNDNTAGSQLNAGQIQAAQVTILGGSEQNDTAIFAGVVESKAGSILVNSFGTVNLNSNLLSSTGLEVSNVSGRVSFGAGRLVKASNGDASLSNGVNEIRFVGGAGTTSSIQSLNGNLTVAALTELATSELIELRADRDVAFRSTLLNSGLQVIAGDRNSNTGTINATSTLTAGSISFESATGIGTNAPVAISTSTISASNRLAGAVQIANNKSGTISVTNLTSNQGGNILFTQSGGGLVRFQGVTSNPDGTPAANESDVRLTNEGNSIIVEGTGVNAGGRGNVSLETLNSGDVVLTSATQANGGNVGVQSARRILGGGTLRGASIGLNAQSGIGTTGPIQTETTQLSVNTQFNSVDVQNTSPTLSTVSQLRSGGLGTVQFKQIGGGDVAISNVSTGLASTSAGSNIQLRNDNGSVSIQGSVVAGGGGSIRFDAQNNLVIGAGAIVQTNAVNATIRGDAGGQFQFTPGATIRAGSSNATTEAVVTQIPPVVSVRPTINSQGVNVDSLGLASVQIQLGSPPFLDRNFSLVIDWGDNQIDNFPNGTISPLTINPQISRFDASGTIYEITHQYQGNPNIVDPIADIPVRVTVGIDALNRIQFNDSQGASTSLSRVVNERFVVPAAGLFTLRFDLPQTATVQSRIVFTNSVFVQADNNIAPPVPSAEIVVSSGSSTVEKSRSYVLRVITLVSEQGAIASSEDIELSDKDIEDLSSGKLFQKLGDNRYRIYLIREDGSELLLKDFYLRNHRPLEVEDAPASSNIAPSDERVLDQGSVSIPRQNLGPAALGTGKLEASEPGVQALGSMSSETTSEEKPIANALLTVGTVSQARRSWRKAARRFRAG